MGGVVVEKSPIHLRCVTSLSDNTFCYEISFAKECTVKNFLDYIMSNENEAFYGFVKIWDERNTELTNPVKYDKRTNKCIIFSPIYMNAVIINARANGGWGCMNFHLTIKTT